MQSAGLLPAFARLYKYPACLPANQPVPCTVVPGKALPRSLARQHGRGRCSCSACCFGSPRQGLTGNLESIAIALDLSTNGACADLSGFSSLSADGFRKVPGYQRAPEIHPLKAFRILRYPPGMSNPPRRMIQVQFPNTRLCAPAGMTDEERAELEAMRAREAEWEAHLEAQEQRLREEQEAQWAAAQQREAECDTMRAQWEEMKGQARAASLMRR